MKKLIVIFLCFCIVAVLSAQRSTDNTMFVAVRTLDLRTATGVFASTSGTLEYGNQVSVLQRSGDWAEISSTANPSVSGWARMASLTARRILPGDTTSATAREVAFAGRGFNQEIENTYKASGSFNYADVDRVETQQVSMDALLHFLIEGRLSQEAR